MAESERECAEMEKGSGISNRLDRKKTMTMNWEGLGDFEDDDDRFFETYNRLSSAVSLDAESSSDEDPDFDDCRISFSSALSSLTTASKASRKFCSTAMSPDYDIWMSVPGSISERRRRLLQGMGLASSKSLLGAESLKVTANNGDQVDKEVLKDSKPGDKNLSQDQQENFSHEMPLMPVLLVRSRSDSEIEMFSMEKRRKEELLGKTSKQRLTRTSSTISAPCPRIYPYQVPARSSSPMVPRTSQNPGQRRTAALTSVISNTFGAFFLIKSLDTGKEFIVNEYDEDGMWNRLSDLQTGKQLTMEEFESSVGSSPVVKELMRRENVNRVNYESVVDLRKFNSYLSKSLRLSKKKGASLLKNIMGVANLMSLKISDKDVTDGVDSPKKRADHRHGKTNQWVKVRQTGKSYKELSALHMCQEIQAHEGSIWTIKFSLDAHFLASGGEDRVIHVWEVQECEIMSLNEGSLTPIHPSLANSMERRPGSGEGPVVPPEKRKKGKSSVRKGNIIPDYVHVPETMFSLSEKPICTFKGHLDDILDLSWSRSQLLLSSSMDKTVRLWDMETGSCLKLFAHNDYVTCIQFNPVDENYFISGSLDAKIRIWNIPDRHVVEWTDLHEMVTAAGYTPDGQGAFIGSHKGICRVYDTEDCKLNQTNQVDVRSTKKSHAKTKITGFQFSPVNPSEVLVTSVDSRIRVLDGSSIIHKFKGFRNTSSQISASYSLDGKYVICASEDSNVYLWRRDDHRTATSTAKRTTVLTQSHEHFQCKDVSVAIPWHGHVRGEPPPVQIHSKRHLKGITSTTQQSPSTSSPKKQDYDSAKATKNKKPGLPPLPKKNPNHTQPSAVTSEEESIGSPRFESGNEEFVRSNSSSMVRTGGDSVSSSARHGSDSNMNSAAASSQFGDSSSISASPRLSSWSWFDNGSNGKQMIQPTAWGMVIVTATLGGEIRAYQNFGLPRRVGRQSTLF